MDERDQASRDNLARAREAAELLREVSPEQALALDRAIEDVLAGRRDAARIGVTVAFRVEKFDAADWAAGKLDSPVEVIDGQG